MRGSNRLEKVAEMDLPIQAGPIWPVPIEGHLLASDLDHVVTHFLALAAVSPSVRRGRGRDSRLIQDPQHPGWKIVQQLSVELQIEVVEPSGKISQDPLVQRSLPVLVQLDFP